MELELLERGTTQLRDLPVGCRVEEMRVERYQRRFEDRPLMSYTPHEVGLEGESLAACSLAERGYEVVDRNWRCGWGEADIICLQGDIGVLVEVKTRLDLANRGLMPEVAVTRQKRERYGFIALCYLNDHPGLYGVRFDVVAVSIVSDHGAHLHHIINAFCWED